MRSSVRIGKVSGITIEINYSWIVIFGLLIWTLAVSHFPSYLPTLPTYHYWAAALISVLLLFFSLIMHELAHSIVARYNGVPIKKVSLYIFGGVAQMEKEPDTPMAELRIAVAGPLCSAALALISYLLFSTLILYSPYKLAAEIFRYIFIVNSVIVVFNLTPGFPLDGGRILRAILWFFIKNLKTSTLIATILGKLFSFAFILGGIYFLFRMQVITGLWFMVIGVFLHEAADLSYQQLILKKALVGVLVRSAMVTDVITVSPDFKLDKLVNDYFYKYRHMGFPVVDKGSFKGIVSLQRVKEIPQEKWQDTRVSDVMIEARPDLIVNPETDCLEALIQVTRSGLGKLIVIENGKLLGMLSQRDLLKLFEIKTHLCR